MSNSLLKAFFSYSRNQQRGIIVLSVSLLLMITYLSIDHYFYQEEEETDRSQEVKEFLAGIENQKPENNKIIQTNDRESFSKNEKPIKSSLRLKPFDPNLVSILELSEMGISDHVAKNFINYRKKVGPFKKKEDVKNLYTINDYLYSKLEAYMEISKIEIEKENIVEKETFLNLNINLADTSELKRIKGIGSFFARQVVKYRDALGGFHSESQYEEVFRLRENEQSLKALLENTSVLEDSWKRININALDKEVLLNHPYFWGNLGRAFANYCKQNGPFENVEDIKGCDLVNDEIYLKIAPYLKLN